MPNNTAATTANTTAETAQTASKKAWGGRFSKPTNAAVEKYLATITLEGRLVHCDIAGSLAHAQMLAAASIISPDEAAAIAQGLREIEREHERGEFALLERDEDIHMAIERRLGELIGPAAGKLHTVRSRNDQIALDERLYLREAAAALRAQITALQEAILLQAKQHLGAIMPGHTHLQIAQPVLYSHWIMSYFWAFERDSSRLADLSARMSECPLGAAALAGTTFAIDRFATARALGFERPSANSIDSVADRDYFIEAAAACAITMMHLSRLCEEIVLFSSAEFGFITLDDAYCTGSSIMPQKKNPDVAEKMRGKSGRVFGDLVALLTLMKGLPSAYNTDMSEDKAAMFDSLDTLASSLEIMAGLIASMQPNAAQMRQAASAAFANATDLADFLARAGVPFRSAHEITGRLVARAIAAGCTLEQLELSAMQEAAEQVWPGAGKLLDDKVYEAINLHTVVAARKSFGGTAPEAVAEQLELARQALAAKNSNKGEK